jgi:hypothetical protein
MSTIDRRRFLSRARGAALYASLAIAACTIPPLDERGKTCVDRCPSGLPCIGGICGGVASDASMISDAGTSTRAISFVQSAYAAPQVDSQSVRVILSSAQRSGDLNVVLVGWNDTASSVSSVTDDADNRYDRALAPSTTSSTLSQSIYYAKNVRASASNGITVVFDRPARFADVRVLEYAGLDPDAPFDLGTGNGGSGGPARSGSIQVRSPPELLVVAGMTSGGFVADGASFVVRVITQPDGDIAGDLSVAGNGPFEATAPVQPDSAFWVMQIATFR